MERESQSKGFEPAAYWSLGIVLLIAFCTYIYTEDLGPAITFPLPLKKLNISVTKEYSASS